MYEQDFQIFLKYKETMIKIFKETVKEGIEFLNS